VRFPCLRVGWVSAAGIVGKGNVEREMKAAMATTGLDCLLEIERRTMKD